MPSDHKDFNILIVDDDNFLLDIYSRRFQEYGATVRVASSGEQALDAIVEQRPDVVLLDLVMPTMSGLAVLDELTARGLRDDIIVIVLTNQAKQQEKYDLTNHRIDGYIVKATATPSEVLQIVINTYTTKHASSI